ncbi:iron complex transport system permease protein [Amycolatopsis xylanica]|uniref:Iron complex transport system permease protein n=1 Tax=Amycolatopsis xylanica TaxID=589385 RepID=A0A1H2U6A9_9PSEU|nr:iron complex transport system permease protein [Amycolatopsis xylanica]
MDTLTRPRPLAVRRHGRLALLGTGLAVLLLLGSAVHLTQGTANLDALDVLRLVFGRGTGGSAAVVVESRLPRLLAALIVGAALGVAGAVLQTVSRNVLASPDTLAVNAGAHLAVTAVAAFGVSLPLLGATGVAFAGGLAAAAVVLGLAGTSGTGIVRLVLAGTAIALALISVTQVLLLLYSQETRGLFAWGEGSLEQNGLGGIRTLGPLVGVAVAALLVLARRLDLIHLGEDHARTLGVHIGRVRFTAIALAVLLAAAAVTLAGPIGFVGLAAPALARLLTSVVPGLHRHAALIPFSAALGAALLLGADVLLRTIIGSQHALEVPTGVVTTLLGAVFLVLLARTARITAATAEPPAAGVRSGVSVFRYRAVLTVLTLAVIGVALGAVLLGDMKLLLGDIVNWSTGQAGPIVSGVLDTRVPRVAAALLAGAALALGGALVQAVARNPLAEPGMIGVVGGAGLGAVAVITGVSGVGFWALTGSAGLGAALAMAVVFAAAARGGFTSERLVLIGFGVHAASQALVTLLITLSDPWNETKALTWLGGSTYGRTFTHLVPMALALLLVAPVLIRMRTELDLLALDDETPRVLGVPVARSRLLLLSCAVLLTGAAVAGIGVLTFVGLVAPHAARAIVGGRHSRLLPTAALLGALLVCVADTAGRTVLAPGQLPAGLMTAIIGAPYFVWLLYRHRSKTR